MAMVYRMGTTQFRGKIAIENVSLQATGDDLIVNITNDDGTERNISLLSVIDRMDELEKNMAELILLGVRKDG